MVIQHMVQYFKNYCRKYLKNNGRKLKVNENFEIMEGPGGKQFTLQQYWLSTSANVVYIYNFNSYISCFSVYIVSEISINNC